MREIIAQKLWIGNAADARDLTRLHDAGICALVDLAFEEPPPQLTRDLVYCRFPITDGAGNASDVLHAAITTVCTLIEQKIPSLVACSAGMSRSPSILATSLALVRGESPDITLQNLVENHPHDVSPLLWSDVKSTYNELLKTGRGVGGGTSTPGGNRVAGAVADPSPHTT